YLWDLVSNKITINSPGSIAGDLQPVGANTVNGKQSPYTRTGNLVLWNDNQAGTGQNNTGHNACNLNMGASNAAAISGNLCLVERNPGGVGCGSLEKALNCKGAGAVGMVVISDSDTLFSILGGAHNVALDDLPALGVP